MRPCAGEAARVDHLATWRRFDGNDDRCGCRRRLRRAAAPAGSAAIDVTPPRGGREATQEEDGAASPGGCEITTFCTDARFLHPTPRPNRSNQPLCLWYPIICHRGRTTICLRVGCTVGWWLRVDALSSAPGLARAAIACFTIAINNVAYAPCPPRITRAPPVPQLWVDVFFETPRLPLALGNSRGLVGLRSPSSCCSRVVGDCPPPHDQILTSRGEGPVREMPEAQCLRASMAME